MKRHSIYIILSAIILTLCAACDSNDGECRKDLTVRMGISLYQMIYNPDLGVFSLQPYTTKITVYGINNDSVLYKDAELNTFEVPLHKTNVLSQFVLKTAETTDTITILHSNVQEFISLECGCQVTHTLDFATTTINGIDSVGIHAPNVTKTGDKNLYVYYHVK